MSLVAAFSARRLKVLSLALMLSGGTVVMTQRWLQGAVEQAEAQARAGGPAAAAPAAAQVLVARTALPAGTILKAEHLRWQTWPADAPTGAYLTSATTRLDQMAGAVVRDSLEAGEPLTAARVATAGAGGALAAVLRPGYRAVTINVNASAGVAGFALPGDHVDVVLSRTVDGDTRRFVSETVLSDVRLLGMDQRAADAKKEVVVPQTATLEVTPKGVEVIAVAGELGKLSLSLRSLAAAETPADEARIVTRTWDRDATQAPIAAPVPRAARAGRPATAAPGPQVEVVRGSHSSSVSAR